jgi:SAM-dependent methyltransferase
VRDAAGGVGDVRRGARGAALTEPAYDRDFWEGLWSRTLHERADQVARRPPNGHLISEIGRLEPGVALDAGCGHGADALWLAGRGWQVTAVDFSAAALAQGRSTAEAAGPDLAGRIDWVEGDLATWIPGPGRYDLVVSLYVHIAGPVAEMVGRMAGAVAPGGTLLLVGHQPIDPATGDPTPAAGQVQVSLDSVTRALDANDWKLIVAEERPRPAAGSGVDAVIRARRRA